MALTLASPSTTFEETVSKRMLQQKKEVLSVHYAVNDFHASTTGTTTITSNCAFTATEEGLQLRLLLRMVLQPRFEIERSVCSPIWAVWTPSITSLASGVPINPCVVPSCLHAQGFCRPKAAGSLRSSQGNNFAERQHENNSS
jgi:hypothetical protein